MTHPLHRTVGRAAGAACFLALAATSQAATVSLFGDRADFLSALGGTATLTQDFESYAHGTDLMGASILPGVTVSTNLDTLQAYQGSGDKELFALARNQPEAIYAIDVSGYRAFGFDIDAFNPATPGPGFLDIYFADGDTTYLGIPVLPLNATEDTPLFQGVISDVAITRIVWREGPEIGGIECCEETALDNFVVAVPEPSAWWMVLAGLGVAVRPASRRLQGRRLQGRRLHGHRG